LRNNFDYYKPFLVRYFMAAAIADDCLFGVRREKFSTSSTEDEAETERETCEKNEGYETWFNISSSK